MAVRVRPTDDLDVIVATTSRPAYERLREQLAQRGIVVDTADDAPTCRFRTSDGLPVDVMPMEGAVVDLRTDWFREAVETAQRVTLHATNGDEASVSLVSAPAFLALKWSAYADRGHANPLMSRDFEDILTIVAGRESIVTEVLEAPEPMRHYIASRFREALAHADLEVAIEDAVPDARVIPDLAEGIRRRLRALAERR